MFDYSRAKRYAKALTTFKEGSIIHTQNGDYEFGTENLANPEAITSSLTGMGIIATKDWVIDVDKVVCIERAGTKPTTKGTGKGKSKPKTDGGKTEKGSETV